MIRKRTEAPMQRPLVGVVVANRSDFNMMRRGLETLRIMGVPYLFEVISPHRSPEKLAEFARSAGERGIEVLITAEGGAALLAARLAANTTLPIIGVPIDASPLRGQDSLFSMVMVPPWRSTTMRRAMSRPRPVPLPISLVV